MQDGISPATETLVGSSSTIAASIMSIKRFNDMCFFNVLMC